ncbi:retrotransposon protein, putative, ty1-copia subclass [Tanacetum coccineum]
MHSMGKTITELHVMLKLHQKGITKKVETHAVRAIKEGKIQKDKKKLQGAKGKDKGKTKLAYAPSPRSYRHLIEIIRRRTLFATTSRGWVTGGETILPTMLRYALKSADRILNMVPTKKVDRTPYENGMEKLPIGYPKETMGYYFYYPFENKIFVAQNAKFFENCLTVQEASESDGLLEARTDWDLNEPPNYKAALSDSEYDKWLDAMNIELQSMRDNQVWCLVDLLPNGRTIGSKWIFKKKTNMYGNVHTFKARLIAKGYTQTYSVDYEETLSPVAYIRDIRILLAITAFYDYEIWQIDVKTPLLNGHLSEEHLKAGTRDLMRKSGVGFTQNSDELCVYLKASGSNVAFLVLYVDDILIMRNNVTMLQDVKSWLCKCFSMKDLEEATYILGIKIIRDRSKRLIALSQSAYFDKILKKFKMENSKCVSVLEARKLTIRKSLR